MSRFAPGDVVLALFPFDDLKGFKFRPILIIDYQNDTDKYRTCSINSLKEKHKNSCKPEWIIRKNTAVFNEMGLEEDSVINFNNQATFAAYTIRKAKKIGVYNHLK